MKIQGGKQPIIVDELKVLRECIGCAASTKCAKDLRKGEVLCHILYRLYTEPGITREQIIKEMEEE